MNQQEVDDAEYRLVENSMAFLRRSVQAMRDAEAHNDVTDDTSFAIVDLAVAAEVLLKARLLRHDWKLVCSKNGKVPDGQLSRTVSDGTANTIGPDKAIELLKNEVGVDLTSNGHATAVKLVGGLRNRAVHFTLTQGVLPIAVKASYGNGLHFVLSFLAEQFRGNRLTEEPVETAIDELTETLGRFTELIRARTADIEGDLRGADVCVKCPRCQQDTLMLTEGEQIRCAFCLWKPIFPDVAAEEYTENVLGMSRYRTTKTGGVWPVSDCVSCSSNAMIEGVEQTFSRPELLDSMPCDGPIRPHWGCFSCGMTAGFTEIHRCTHCDEPTVMGGDDGTPVCADCWGDLAPTD